MYVCVASILLEMNALMERELANSPSWSRRVGLVLAGDLSHAPDSPLYQFLQKGRLFVPAAVAEAPADSFNDSKGWVRPLLQYTCSLWNYYYCTVMCS